MKRISGYRAFETGCGKWVAKQFESGYTSNSEQATICEYEKEFEELFEIDNRYKAFIKTIEFHTTFPF